MRGDKVKYRADAGEFCGFILSVETWLDVVKTCRTELAAREFGRAQTARLGLEWQSLYWHAMVERDGGEVDKIDCLQLVENFEEPAISS